MKIIEVKNLSVKYRGIDALSNVTLGIDSGDYIGIVGPNGSGKTTFIRALLGLVPFGGEIYFQGKSFSDFFAGKHVGYLPQRMSFLDQSFPATAEEIVLSGVYCCKRFPKRLEKEDYAAAEKVMELLGITPLKERSIGRLSGGQQQRILLARALVHEPELLILDEPTVALDPQSSGAFYATVQRLNKEKGTTVLLVSHDIGSVGNYASKMLYLDRGLIFYGTFEEFCKSPKMTDYFGVGQHLICHRH
ncbi:MAG: metal ABC transporter ATP-binding protein [Candidatus Omnitrophica bacterium]|nr:metal ABC transporter ATP-binding protein [Candidatus Omnitrophota bacterium]MBU4479810.1 metal ABC transporter ATP-binding protein [Candidatus Omnitrophota bacterium]MCG2704412.1 metal ABC transporter ATP-binding protein [Candidatus Omnitrophota bacterium]